MWIAEMGWDEGSVGYTRDACCWGNIRLIPFSFGEKYAVSMGYVFPLPCRQSF
jgi:hypothetical protein